MSPWNPSQPIPRLQSQFVRNKMPSSSPSRRLWDPLKKNTTTTIPKASSSDSQQQQSFNQVEFTSSMNVDTSALPENFCIIESRDSVKNFASMQLEEISQNIQARRNRIFLLLEEVRRLRIQQRLKGGPSYTIPNENGAEENYNETYPSTIPFFPPINEQTIQLYINFYLAAVAAIVLFGGLIAPVLEVRLGIGGTSYYDFIAAMHLPRQLAQVDPIVASFCGGAVGVLTSLLVVEANNAKMQAKRRCIYCGGTGYLPCGNCAGVGVVAGGESCVDCAGTGKVMCTSCLCTGKQLATEHDPRIDPFNLNDF